ncbi:MAG: hypothetical protein OXH57_08625 [Ekhidna sp.]|nr:hypothetical protein [Ekhidna sp.]
MKLSDIILFAIASSLFIIGIHQAIVVSLAESYWIFMFSLMPLFLYGYRKGRVQERQKNSVNNAQKRKKNTK